MHVPLLCSKTGVAVFTFQGVLVKHAQFFCAGGAAVRSGVAITVEGFPWARLCVFQHSPVKTTRDDMHLWTFLPLLNTLVAVVHMKDCMLRTHPQEDCTADCREKGASQRGISDTELPEVNLLMSQTEKSPMLSIREHIDCVLEQLLRTLLMFATIKKPHGAT